MTQAKRGLGRGLEALIPAASEPSTGIIEVEIDHIAPNPMQPRHVIDPEALRELAESIREHGIIQPVIVTQATKELQELRQGQATSPHAFSYFLIVGERRWRAARLAGLQRIPAIIKDATPRAMLELALVENLQRADLNPLEAANAYRYLIDEFRLTQEQVATRVAKHRVTVANTLRLLRLAEPVKEALASGQLSEGHARAILQLEEPAQQIDAAERIVRQGLNVRQTEELVRRIQAGTQPKTQINPTPETKALEEQFRQALGTKVQLFRSRKGGRLVIHYYSEEELQGLYDTLVRDQ
jgi:ParB family transcriptional regulator, chromosome partitioning protein